MTRRTVLTVRPGAVPGEVDEKSRIGGRVGGRGRGVPGVAGEAAVDDAPLAQRTALVGAHPVDGGDAVGVADHRDALAVLPDDRRRVIMGVRPMDLTVGAEADLAIDGEVFLVEPIGPISYVDADVGGRAVKGVVDPDRAPAIGERVTFGFPASRVHLFDPASEARL